MKVVKIFGREPAVWLAALGAAWQIASAFGLNFSDMTQSVVTAIVAAALGLYVAYITHDGIYASVNGFVVAGVSLVSYFALHWDAEHQAKFVGAIMLLVAAFVVRPVVTPRVGADASPAGKLVA